MLKHVSITTPVASTFVLGQSRAKCHSFFKEEFPRAPQDMSCHDFPEKFPRPPPQSPEITKNFPQKPQEFPSKTPNAQNSPGMRRLFPRLFPRVLLLTGPRPFSRPAQFSIFATMILSQYFFSLQLHSAQAREFTAP
jgi:hypothetical protein